MKKRERSPGRVEFSEERVELVNDGSREQRHSYQLQNRGPGSVRVRAAIGADSDPVFSLVSGGEEKYVAPGLKLPVVLQYSPGPHEEGHCHHRGSLEVFVNSCLSLTIPISTVPPCPRLFLSQEVVDVGCLVTEHQIHTTSFSLSNMGTRQGTFFIDTSPLPPWISLQPTSGELGPGQSTQIQIEILCKEEIEFSYALRIHTSDPLTTTTAASSATDPSRTSGVGEGTSLLLRLCGRLQTRALRVLDPLSLSPLHSLSFPPTYYDTTTSKQVILYNESPVSTDYLCLLDNSGCGGSEVGGGEGLAMALTAGGLGQERWGEQGAPLPSQSLLSVLPSQGTLLPYEKKVLELTFAPTFISSDSGWSHIQTAPTRRDYSLFLTFLTVNNNNNNNNKKRCHNTASSRGDLLLAVCATALPVDVLLEPMSPLQFGPTPTMYPNTQHINVHNKSESLPLHFTTHRLPHYTCHPPSGHIPPSHTLTLSLTFTPKQLGPLNARLLVDILTPASKGGRGGPGVVKTLEVELRGEGVSKEPTEGGKRGGDETGKINYAQPDDLATSIRPYDGYKIVTPYTRTPRYTYVDRDYAYSEGERQEIQWHREHYLHFLRGSRAQRLWTLREKALAAAACGPERELGMLSLKAPSNSPTLSSSNSSTRKKRRRKGGAHGVMTTDDINTASSVELREVEQCSTTADSPQVNSEVSAHLSPQQLSLVTITPGVLDYGVIAVNSVVEMTVTIKNSLNQHIRFTFELSGSGVKCPLLPPSSSSSHLILPPLSFTHLPFTIHCDTTGLLERCVECLVNGHHVVRLPVHLETVPLSLSLSTNTLTLSQPPIAPPSAGLRGYLEVENKLNIPASFQWHARDGVDTSVFFMVHPTGVVPAHSSLHCEFVCLPTYESADSALFRLVVLGPGTEEGDVAHSETTANSQGGADCLLTLKTELGRPVCCFKEKRVLFGSVPLGLTTVQTVHLMNNGDSHAFFKVMNPEPCAGLKVTPESGCVPVGGVCQLRLHAHPQSEALFDTELTVAVRGGKRLGLKLVGAAEEPKVTIDRESFIFGGVYCGSRSSLPFAVSNLGSTRCEILFDFSFLTDFSLDLPQQTSPYAEVTSGRGDPPGIHTLQLPAKTSALCHLILSPKDVAAYDFELPVLVNGSRPPSPPPSPWPPSSHHSSKITITTPSTTHPQHTTGKTGGVLGSYGNTPRRRVLATAVRAPVSLSLSHFSFSFPTAFLETMTEPVLHNKPAQLKNEGDSPVWWTLVTSGVKRLEDGTFHLVLPSGEPLSLPPPDLGAPGPGEGEVGYLRPGESFRFSVQCYPGHHGEFQAEVPLLLLHPPATPSDTTSSPAAHTQLEPYCTLTLSASVPPSTVSFSTSSILLQPVPLDITISAQYSLLLHNFPSPVDMEAVVPAPPEGTSLAVEFPRGTQVPQCGSQGTELPVELEFSSSRPVSLTGQLLFRDKHSGKKVRVAYGLAADNSVLSVAQFLAQSVAISSVQLNQQHVPMLNVSSRSNGGGGGVSTSSAVSLATTSQARGGLLFSHTPLTASFTEDFSYSDIFMQESVNAVCRWVSCYGWAQGTRHITSPTDLRERVGHNVPKRGVKQRSSIREERGQLVELVSHLCGRMPPGIPMNPPPCTSPSEKINQQFSTLNTIISFLRNQGGEVWCLTAEGLLDYRDYQQWLLDTQSPPSLLPPPSSLEEFQDRSYQAWTYLLLLIIKVLVLPRVVCHVPVYLREKVGDLDTSSSNVYGHPERVLLAWLNHHYSTQRATVLGSTAGDQMREVVSFDMDLMDCTVLACVLSAYCPFLVSSHISALYSHPCSAEQCSHNALVLCDAMAHIGLTYDCQASDLTTPTPVFLLLLCAHLYTTLPSLSPSPSPSLPPPPPRTILLEGLLHSNIRQKITLDNPSTKPLNYRALLRGEDASQFIIVGSPETLSVEGGKSASVEVGYSGHHLGPCEAVLLLVSDGGGRGSSLAFQLIGRVTGAIPQSRVQVGVALYQSQTVSLSATSHFVSSALFDVSLYESTDPSLLSSLTPATTRKKTVNRSLGAIPVTALQKRTTDKMTSFNLHTNQITLDPGVPTTLNLTFVPLKMEPRHCTVVLRNEVIGEIVLSLTATVHLPFPTLPKTSCDTEYRFFVNRDSQTLHLKAYVSERVQEDLYILSENPGLERALVEVCQWGMEPEERRRRILTNSLTTAALTTAKEFLQLNESATSATDSIGEHMDKLVFNVEGSDENFELPETVCVPGRRGGVGRCPVGFVSDTPGQFECRVVLRSDREVRVFIIESTVLERGREVVLEFATTAMQPLTQDIPIVNPSTVEWPLEATLKGSGFSGPDSLLSQPLSTTCYPLTFHLNKEGTVEGELCLVNGNDGTEHRFQLRGVAEKPLAQDYIHIHTQAKTSLTHILHVPNHNERTTEFRVESDLTCVSGPNSLTITGGDLVDYPLLVKPIRRGVLFGAVAFVAQPPGNRDRRSLSAVGSGSRRRRGGGGGESPHHVWFEVEVRAEPAPPDQVVPITCPTLSSVVTHLPITNSHPHPLTLTVVVGGEYVSGPGSLVVDANRTTTYPLIFAPSLIGDTSGEVIFDGGPEGEFWYQLQLAATDPTPVTLPNTTCELGKTEQVCVPLRNPLDHSVVFSCQCSNTRHFIIPALTDSQVEVEAGGSIDVPVLFKPSCVGSGDHVTHISFNSTQFGEQVFILQGEGSEPSQMEPTTIRATLNSNTTHVVSFTNPLDTPTLFNVSLSDSQQPSAESFCLLLKRTHGILLRPGVSLDIPIMFVPEKMTTHRTNMTISTEGVSSGSKLVWQYPIIGEPQFSPVSPKSAPKIDCHAKERVEERLEVLLVSQKMNKAAVFCLKTPNIDPSANEQGLPQQSEANGQYAYELVCGESEYSDIIRDCVVVKLLRKAVNEEGHIKLLFGFIFVPPRALSCTVELHVSVCGSGGVWKFPVHLCASMADPDDVIVIEATSLNRETQIQFRLSSMQEHPLPFTAHLAHGSDPDITVSPTSGELSPVNSRGTLFFITYKPRTYGRVHKAKLIVNCQSSEWCYEIVGRPALYSPPTTTGARVQHRATPPPLILTQTRKNFIRENMKLGKSRQPVQ